MEYKGWRPAAVGCSGGFRHVAGGQSHHPDPTRGKRYGRMDVLEEDGWKKCAAGWCPCSHLR